ncbi:hypothetical protein [Apilactobacillus timberlakei]|uniref:hypothetical protein n=1 Tax=Apilactobacillus timberlakei TaxID=2008380 RepID=UPI0011262818|nr:hypothetical protein [Apilactobacillus timberlakei]TPR19356.1 hypothetical protein DYZ95_01700 [Apilactobacillus timberlakei]
MKKGFNFMFIAALILFGIFLLNRPHLSNGIYVGSSKQSELILNHYDHYFVSNRGQLPSKLQGGHYTVSGNEILLNHEVKGHINNKKSFELFDGNYKEKFKLLVE